MKPMDRKSTLSVFLASAVLLAATGPAWCKGVPGADLVRVASSKALGYALISRYELFLSPDGAKWRSAGLAERRDALTALAAGSQFILAAGESGTLYRTRDGKKVENLPSPRDPFGRVSQGERALSMMAFSPSGKEVLASSGQGLFVSRDGGTRWEPVRDPFWNDPSAREVLCAAYAGENAVVVTRNGIYLREKTGFAPVRANLPEKDRPLKATAEGGKVLVGYAKEGLFETGDGKTWNRLAPPPDMPVAFAGWVSGGYLAAGAFSPLHQGTGKGEWKRVGGGLSPAFVPLSSVSAPGGALVVLKGKGLFRIDKGALAPVDLPLELASIHVQLDPGKGTVAGTQAGIFFREAADKPWKDVTPASLGGEVTSALSLSDGRYALGSPGFGLFISADKGKSWQAWNAGLSETTNTINALAELDGVVYAATENGLMRKTLSPETPWEPDNRGIPRVNVMEIAASGGVLWAILDSQLYFAGKGAEFAPLRELEGGVSELAAAENGVAAVFNGRIMLKEGTGGWKELPSLAEAVPVSLALAGGKVWAGTDRGVFLLQEGIWSKTGKESFPVAHLVPEGNRVRVVTRGAGTYRLP